MGTKRFINNTGYNVSVTLAVPEGADPGPSVFTRNFQLSVAGDQVYTYSDDLNPFLNGISVAASDTEQGTIVGADFIGSQRGTTIDNDLNMNDTVLINLQSRNIVLAFENTGVGSQ
ncbi:hypothetical protein [Deinococcus cellulosilyticus]|uniref:Uncharacterized protein n=1 Tax=Deinococcus cellulosilyticus (strain DSM 18568 / NBRC 106333 / KACC 11606 / 5516J-15) TaxID=1223518 RepID=A0A511MX04_DEIC1|nr:hypothetical protein [Deinococcus cellulosilyticus]GEM44666.1 hypothetical protein DC3_03010 [Deinococcus cellulosilyticus NBRC 106333 = KACC 11606]